MNGELSASINHAKSAPFPATKSITRQSLFSSVPFTVLQAITRATTRPTTCEALKLMFVSRGASTLSHETGQLDLPTGSLVLLPANCWYVGTPKHPVETLTLYIDPDYVEDQLRWLCAAAPFLEALLIATEPVLLCKHPLQKQAVSAQLKEIARTSASLSPDSEFSQLAQLGRLLATLHDQAPFVGNSPLPQRPEVAAAVRLLLEQLDGAWTTDQLACEVALSPSQLTRLFTRHLGVSPSRYLREARAQRMYELLATQEISVRDAAREVGWHDQSHAARAFRSTHGVSPQQLRSEILIRDSHRGQFDALGRKDGPQGIPVLSASPRT